MNNKLLYLVCGKQIEFWIEDFVDEDNGDVISIERRVYETDSKQKDVSYLTTIELPETKQKLTPFEIEAYCNFEIKRLTKKHRFLKQVTARKYKSLIAKSEDPKYSSSYKLLRHL